MNKTITFSIALTLASFAHADVFNLVSVCKASLLAVKRQLPPNQTLDLPDAVWEKLIEVKSQWMANRKPTEYNHDGRWIPKSFYFKNDEYKYIQYLGCGGESHVYLVERQGELFALKHFGRKSVYKENMNLIDTLEARGLPIELPIDKDSKMLEALFTYVDGFTMTYFMGSSFYKDWRSPLFDLLPRETIELVKRAFEEFQRQYDVSSEIPRTDTTLIPENVVLDLKNKKFKIIDAH